MHFAKLKMIGPAAAIDWWRFRKEGDAYLRRLGVSDDIAIWAVAKLYLLNWQAWRKGRHWNSYRQRWERPEVSYKIDTPKVFGPDGEVLLDLRGRPLPKSMAPEICERCGGFCAPTASMCLPCWQKVRPRRDGGSRTNSPKQIRYLSHLLRSQP